MKMCVPIVGIAQKYFLVLGTLCFLFVAPGCNDGRPQRVPVSGRVLIDGKPLEFGFIRVTPTRDRPAIGEIGPEGRFSLRTFEPHDGCVPGKHPVTVFAMESIDENTTKYFVPKKYNNLQTSGLEIEVAGPRDDVQINLTWDGGKPFIEKDK